MNKNIKNAFRLGALATAGLFAISSCTDKWDEHYEAASPLSFDGTLMEAIQSYPELSNFAEVVEAAGYDLQLSSNQMMTLWAPVISDHVKDSLLAEVQTNKDEVITMFIQNHMALYNISMTPKAQHISLINDKYVDMGTAQEAKIGESTITKGNIVCTNGVLHLIDCEMPYVPSLYEAIELDFRSYLRANGLSTNDSVISLYSFLNKYNEDILDEAKSVELGLDPDGNMVYVDSVMIRNNIVLKGVNAPLYEEDSTFYAIVPSVEAYQARYAEILPYLNYRYDGATPADSAYRDSVMVRMANTYAMSDLYFNTNLDVNSHPADSMKATVYSPMDWEFDVFKGLFSGNGDLLTVPSTKVACSNGTMYKVDEYPFSIYDQLFRKITTTINRASIDEEETVGNTYTEYCTQAAYTYVRETTDGAGNVLESQSYSATRLSPTSSRVNVTFAVRVPKTLAGEYDIKFVVLSPQALSGDSNDMRRYKFRANVFERQADGTYKKNGDRLTNPDDGGRDFYSNPENFVDTISLGSYKFTYGNYDANLEGTMIQVVMNVRSNQTDEYVRDILAQKIILEPKRNAATEPVE